VRWGEVRMNCHQVFKFNLRCLDHRVLWLSEAAFGQMPVSMMAHSDSKPAYARHAMSLVGTFRTWCDVRLESAFGGIAEVAFRGRQVRVWTLNGHREGAVCSKSMQPSD
jgi:hypothetical protein